MEYFFWIFLGCLLHTYLFYPFLLKILADFKGTPPPVPFIPANELPNISILISAYNESGILLDKIENLLEMDYPHDKMEILIGSDGSVDQTNEILESLKTPFKVFLFEKNRGKASVINDLAIEASGEILVFCDANTFFLPNALKLLTAAFQNEKIGCVSGRLLLNDSGKTSLGEGESLYWQLESKIKELEGSLHNLMGVNGAIYALRKRLYSPIPTHKKITDDFFLSVQVLRKEYHSIYLKQSIGVESTSKSADGEFHRKVRIGEANFNYFHLYLPLLNPMKPLVAFIFFSHKLLRWFSPHLMILVGILNFFIAFQQPIYSFLFTSQILFYSFAFAGYTFKKTGPRSRITTLSYYFVTMNWALLLGFFHALNPSQKGGGWERIERDED